VQVDERHIAPFAQLMEMPPVVSGVGGPGTPGFGGGVTDADWEAARQHIQQLVDASSNATNAGTATLYDPRTAHADNLIQQAGDAARHVSGGGAFAPHHHGVVVALIHMLGPAAFLAGAAALIKASEKYALTYTEIQRMKQTELPPL
jgi:hypothetical protein